VPQVRLEPRASQYVFRALDLSKVTMKEAENVQENGIKQSKVVKQKERANARH
jgi:hypothetical protein